MQAGSWVPLPGRASGPGFDFGPGEPTCRFMTRVLLATALLLIATSESVAQSRPGPTVITREGDVIAPILRRDRPLPEAGAATARDLDRSLLNLGTRRLRTTGGALSDRRLERDLDITSQRFEALRTRNPQNTRIPILERRLDRLRRPTRLGR